MIQAQILADPIKGQEKREKNRMIQAQILADPIKGQEKRENNRMIQAKLMDDPEKGALIRKNDRISKEKNKNDPIKSQIKRDRDKNQKVQSRKNNNNLIQIYENAIKDGPTYICVCCGGLFFKRSVKKFNKTDYNDLTLLNKILNVDQVSIDSEFKYICITCDKYSKSNKVPRLALSNGLKFNTIPSYIYNLNDLEERLCSPRIPFLKIKQLGWDAQKGNLF